MPPAYAQLIPSLPPTQVRSIVVGLLVGSLMCFTNMYFGLQTGWISMMSLQSALLGFAVFKPFQGRMKTPFGPVENVLLQTTAVATATMPLAGGFVGIIPALAMLEPEEGRTILSFAELVIWGMGIAFFGVFFAVPLRKQVIVKEKLPFPSGTATAQMIAVLHRRLDPEDTPVPEASSLRQRLPHSATATPVPIRADSPPTSPTPPITTEAAAEAAEAEKDWSQKLRALLLSFTISSFFTLIAHFIPVLNALPLGDWVSAGTIPFAQWNWFLTPSLSYVGQGVIMGVPTCLSMLAGAVVGWAGLGPLAKAKGWAPGPVNDQKIGARGWILWISLAVMISESLVGLGVILIKDISRRFRTRGGKWDSKDVAAPTPGPLAAVSPATRIRSATRDAEDLRERRVSLLRRTSEDLGHDQAQIADYDLPPRDLGDVEGGVTVRPLEDEDVPDSWLVPASWTYGGLVLSSLLCVFCSSWIFGIQWYAALISVVLACLLSVLAVRALGETDMNPVSGIGKVSQFVIAGIVPGGLVANLVAGGIAEAGAQQAGDMMQDLKTGHLIGASPRAQFWGQLIGSFFSVIISVCAYTVYTTVYTIPGPDFQVPTAFVWLDMARLVNGHALPPNTTPFIIAFALLGALPPLLEAACHGRRFLRFVPSAVAFAIGMMITPNYTLPRVIGALVGEWAMHYKVSGLAQSKSRRVLVIVIASGLVLGEGTFSLVNMILKSMHIGAATCVGCLPGLCGECTI